MNTIVQPSDHVAREEALNPERSFAVSAPAGSGKTGLLTHRLLKLLLTVKSPEQVLAITFTNKAASEMQERVLHALIDARDNAMPGQAHQQSLWQTAKDVLARDSELNWQLLNNPNRLKILTIDGLSRSIVSQLPIDSKLGGAPDNLDDPESAYREAAQNLLSEMEVDNATGEALIELAAHLDNQLEKVVELLVRLLGKREQWLPLIMSVNGESARQSLESSLEQVVEEHLAYLTELLWPVQSDIGQLLDGIGSYLAEEDPDNPYTCFKGTIGLPAAQVDKYNLWQALGQIFLSSSGDYRKRQDKRTGFPAGKVGKPLKDQFLMIVETLQDCAPEALLALREIKTLPAFRYSDNEWAILNALSQILPRLVAQLWVVFAARGASDFTEVALAALHALKDEEQVSDILLKLDHQIQHILIDEFQDTSLPQFELLEKLTTGWEAGDGRTLFLVGDGMQSCYGFRNANVGLFLKARRQGIGDLTLHPLDLTVNFRSQAGVVDWVNQTFAQAFPSQDDISRGAVKYNPSDAFKPKTQEPAVVTYLSHFDSAIVNKDQARQREAEHIVDLIIQTQERRPDASIAVLGRARSHLQLIMQELGKRRLDYIAQDMESLAGRMVIIDLLTLTRVMLQPDNRIAWLSLLRTPWVGLDHFDLCTLVGESDREAKDRDIQGFEFIWQILQNDERLQQLSNDGQMICTRLVTTLKSSFSQSGRKSLASWIYGTWLALGGPAGLLRDSDHRDAEQYFNLLQNHDSAGRITDWPAFDRAIEKLFSDTANAHSNIQLMTLHKSKGLEFDTVFIAGLDRRSANDDKQLILWRERLDLQGQAHLLLSPVAPTGDDQGALYQHLKYEQKLQSEYELTRLFYVGCTRAIENLYLTGCVQTTEPSDGEAPVPANTKPQGLLKQLWPLLETTLKFIAPNPERNQSSQAPSSHPGTYIRRLQANWSCPALADNPTLAHLRTETPPPENARNLPEYEPKHARLLRITGTLIHSIFEQLCLTGLPDETETYCLNREKAWRSILLKSGVLPEDQNQCIEIARHAITQALSTRTGCWLLNNQHESSLTELELYSKSQTATRRHVIDRTFIERDTRWIIDYKTTQKEPDEALESFVTRLKEEYRPQLERYRDLFSGSEHTLQCAIYNPLLPEEHALILY
ncbi:UvrD-helicase domain-containing protein [Gilvimarinus sp. 1_MG-2023]|uniref:UvrD-helicase domain-containing protein n=1 Tax=Gilvimarinus sp. 1_MG-2023 TaxID=3062638 RepID=UPI0026E3EB6E|nr:UvrD-helicase domain-containing protein [Gilvimarinus sp. 1_MG-2023]MDO6745894.1 UvrD-helicase domain-containing protein [Gilvimarinus sp. 1_MG-2023]